MLNRIVPAPSRKWCISFFFSLLPNDWNADVMARIGAAFYGQGMMLEMETTHNTDIG